MKVLRRLLYSIKNVIRWFPVIWRDRDWDHRYFFRIMQNKIKNMEHYSRVHGHLVSSETQANEMKRVYLLLKRLTGDIYNDMVFTEFDKKWGEATFSINEDDSLNITYENELTKEDKVELLYDLHEAFKRENYLKKQDVNYLFDLIKKHVLNWWD